MTFSSFGNKKQGDSSDVLGYLNFQCEVMIDKKRESVKAAIFLTIKRALPNMFWYLDNEKIPKTTNGIESYFGHLKNHLDLHRGVTTAHRINFTKWYIYFRNKSKL